MIYRYSKITIIKSNKPAQRDINEQLQWLGLSLGLFNLRDKDRSCFRIFIQLLKNEAGEGLTSDELAEKLNLSRGTVIHHIHKLVESGLVVRNGSRYFLRAANLEALIDEILKDVERTYQDMREVAKELDSKLRLN